MMIDTEAAGVLFGPSAEVTLAQLDLPGLTVEQIEEAERETLRLRYE